MPRVTVASASAGTGKTYRLASRVAEAIESGIDPARVLATTFTRKAASELKERIAHHMKERGHIAAADLPRLTARLDLAFIGTVDAVAFRLLKRHAFQAGLSPALEILDEKAAERALARALEAADETVWQAWRDAAAPFGISDLPGVARKLLDMKRTNGISDEAFRAQLEASAAAYVGALCGGDDPVEWSFAELAERMARAIKGLDGSGDETKVTRTCIDQLVGARGEVDAERWSAASVGSKLKPAKKSMAHVQDVVAYAASARRATVLHDHIRTFLAKACDLTVAASDAFATYKAERGLVDYADLELHVLALLNNKEHAASIAAGFDFVVVDEFQDTNPLQLALFVRLAEHVPDVFWVGDPKQAIYGFRGSDAELMGRVWNSDLVAARENLGTNRRSQAHLVAFFNALFEPSFGPEAVVDPHREALPTAVEEWRFVGRYSKHEHAAIASGIVTGLGEGRFGAGDVAVLMRTRSQVEKVAAALRERGVPTEVEEAGLLATREGVVVTAALRFVADERDDIAVALLLHHLGDALDGERQWLSDRVTAAARDDASGWPDHPDLAALAAVDAEHATPVEIVARVIATLRLADRIAAWGSPHRRAANLDAIMALAATFEEESVRLRRPATLVGFVRALRTLEADGEDARPTIPGAPAVTVTTYHASKGLQWPVVVLGSLDDAPRVSTHEPVVTGGADPRTPLAGRAIDYWPNPFGELQHQARTLEGVPERLRAAPLGQDLTARATDEARRLAYVGFTRARDQAVVVTRRDAPNGLVACDLDFPSACAAIGEAAVVREVAQETESLDAAPAQPWPIASGPAPQAPRFVPPSATTAATVTPVLDAQPLPGAPAAVPIDGSASWQRVGHALHAYFAALPSFTEATDRGAVATAALRDHQVEALLAPNALVDASARFLEWVEATFPGATVATEVPVTAPRGDGSSWRGVVDALIVLPDGGVAVVDHKSVPVTQSAWERRASEAAPQLFAYEAALRAIGCDVRGLFVHLPLGGGIVAVRSGSDAAP